MINDHLIKFLENNGRNLKEIDFDLVTDDSINLTIAKFRPNLKSLCIVFKDNEIEALKVI